SQKVRRSHDGDLISVWKGDRSEPTTLRATARRCLDPFHDPRPSILREAQPAGQLPAVSRPLPRPPACTKASPYKRQTTACTKATPYKRPCKLFPRCKLH